MMATSETCSFKIILGSSSMARRQILGEMGYEFTILTADIDEKSIRKENPEELVVALAEAKADAIISRLKTTGYFEDDASSTVSTLLITADTADALILSPCFNYMEKGQYPELVVPMRVIESGTIREKPSSKDEVRQFIKGYSGGQASVVGSVVVTNLTTGNRKGGWDRAEVYFYDIPDEVIDSLVEEGTMLNVAGGLMLEHPLTLPFIDTVAGSADSVMGLSKALTEKLIQGAL